MTINPKLPSDWLELLYDEFQKPYFLNLKSFLLDEKKCAKIYPKGSDIFNAFNMTRFDDLKVVILGQDPYHGPFQAHGLSFSVQDGIAFPPSLQNIFKELTQDMGCSYPLSGNLTHWAQQGVFLLNTVLTVRENQAHSHRDQGWEQFSDSVIRLISQKKEHVVFILWGKPAQAKASLIDSAKHLILKSVHPSPLSVYRGFFGSKPFSNANNFLSHHKITPISWCL